MLGNWGGTPKSTLSGFRALSGTDADSLVATPLFVNMTGTDGILGFANGGLDHGSWTMTSTTRARPAASTAARWRYDASTGLPVPPTATLTADASESPAIDRGDPAAAFSLAGAGRPTAGALNIGVYGNTARKRRKSRSSVCGFSSLLPNGGEIGVPGGAEPPSSNGAATTSSGSTVNIDLLAGERPWRPQQLGEQYRYRCGQQRANVHLGRSRLRTLRRRRRIITSASRLRGQARLHPASGRERCRRLHDQVAHDDVLRQRKLLDAPGDITTTQPGDDSNDGLSPSTPMASIAAQLAANQYTLGDER